MFNEKFCKIMIIKHLVERGKFVLNNNYKHVSNVEKKGELLISNNLEVIVTIHKMFLSHWVLQDLVSFI